MKKAKPSSPTNVISTSQSKVQKKSQGTPLSKKKSKTLVLSNKNQQSKGTRSQPQDYIIINDSIYSANTFTQRNNYEQFLVKVKKQKQVQRKSFLVKSQISENQFKKSRNLKRKLLDKLSPQDFLQTMTLQEKKEMFYKLRDDIRGGGVSKQYHKGHSNFQHQQAQLPKQFQNLSQRSQFFENQPSKQTQNLKSQRQRKQKFDLIEQKLQNLKLQLMFKWQGQIDKLEQLHAKNKITEKQKQNKILMSQKIKDHKLKILDCTKTLFQKILREEEYEKQHNQDKSNKIQAILQSLHSFPSLQSLEEHCLQKQPSINHLKFKEKQVREKQNIESSPLQIVERNSHQAFLNEFKEDQCINGDHSRVKQFRFKYKNTENTHSAQQLSPQNRKFAQFQQSQSFDKSRSNESNHLNANQYTIHGLLEKEQMQLPDKIFLKLDLRLDQVIFGQDQYPQCEKDEVKYQTVEEQSFEHASSSVLQIKRSDQSKNISQTSFQQIQHVQSSLVFTSKESPSVVSNGKNSANINQSALTDTTTIPVDCIITVSNEGVLSPKSQCKKVSLSSALLQSSLEDVDDSLVCKQQSNQKMNIHIPLILTRDKMQILQFQRNRSFRQNLDKRIAFQMGCIQMPESTTDLLSAPNVHFTTLVDINAYIIGFYEFMMAKCINTLVDNLNIPYGKSVLDKLYSLQADGYVLEQTYNDLNNILSEANFFQYQRQMTFAVKKCTEYEISHNRAVFQAFTKCINVYRPYFQLQGQVYPWVVSQKGITFYEITDQNIEEVFQKSKIKVLQYCTTLCGLHPPSEIKNQAQRQLVTTKIQQNLTKMIKAEIIQQFHQWNIRFVNYECLIKILTAQQLYYELMKEFTQEISTIEQKKSEQYQQK